MQNYSSSLVQPPVCDPDGLPLGFPVYPSLSTLRLTTTSHPRRLRSLGPYVRRSIGFSLFPPGPQPVARSGRNPRRHSDLGWLFQLAIKQIHMPSCLPLAGDAVLQVVVTKPTLTSDHRMFTLDQHRKPSDWWLHSAAKPRTSTTFPLPLQLIGDHC